MASSSEREKSPQPVWTFVARTEKFERSPNGERRFWATVEWFRLDPESGRSEEWDKYRTYIPSAIEANGVPYIHLRKDPDENAKPEYQVGLTFVDPKGSSIREQIVDQNPGIPIRFAVEE